MTREEIKKVLPVIQAFSEGKVIQTKNGDETWITIGKETDLNIESLAEYPDCFRIKPEPNYRPFKNAEECWQEMQKHQPFGWIKDKNDGHYSMVTTVDAAAGEDKKHIGISGGNIWTLSETMCDYTFADGEPFGINIEEE